MKTPSTPTPPPSGLTPEQRRRNVRTGLLLAAFAVAVLVWTLVRATLYGVVS